MKQHKTLLFNFNGQELEIRLDEQKKSAYLSERHIALLFSKSRGAIYNQIKQLKLKQTDPSLCLKLKQTGVDGKLYLTNFYSLDIVFLIGQKFNSNAADILKDFINDQLNKNQVVQRDYENDIIIYNNGSISLAVKVSPEEDTVLLTQSQIAALYETTRTNVTKHIQKILEEGELSVCEKNSHTESVHKKNLHTESVTEEFSATHKNRLSVHENNSYIESVNKKNLYTENFIHKIPTLAADDKTYDTTYYNLDMILAIGYRVKSKRAMEFRRWVSRVLKQYLIKGYVIDANRVTISKENFIQMENDVKSLEKRVTNIEEKMFVEPVKERLFFNGQYFDAYEFLVSLIIEAKRSIIIIDPYFDIRGLKLLSHASRDVRKIVCYSSSSKLKDEDVKPFEKQYGTFEVIQKDIFHDRFIIIDNEKGYQIGTSINNAGGKIFSAFRIDSNLFVKHILEAMK